MSQVTNDIEQQAQDVIPGDIRMISGCADSQTSADVSSMGAFQLPADVGMGGAGGACSGAFSSVITSTSSSVTWSYLLNEMRGKLLQRQFSQVPQLSSSRNLGLDGQFGVVTPGGKPKRAVFIGINYTGMQGELRGCHNDADMIRKVVQSKLGMAAAETRMFKDDGGKSESPTRNNILNAFAWLVQDAQPGDCIFLHYSGHGGYVTDSNGDEKDGRDETIVPVDYERAGQITDDEIYQKLVLSVPKGVVLTVIMDCCHSGSVFDLPFYFLQTNETDMNAPAPVMQVNPAFDWKKVFDLGMKLYKLRSGGASFSQIGSAAMAEINQDPALKQTFMKAATSATKLVTQYSSGKVTSGGDSNKSAGPSESSGGGSVRSMAKLGASLLMAANEAGSQPNPAAGFASFMGKASKFF